MLEEKYACTLLSVTGHPLAAVEGCYVKVMENCPCQPMLENMRTYHCILYYAHTHIIDNCCWFMKEMIPCTVTAAHK
jgi:hypothetical protein